jgi:hypothetical protein
MPFHLSDLLSLAKDYRGEYPTAKNPYTGDHVSPRVFGSAVSPIKLLAKRLRHAKSTSFEFEGHTVSNTTSDGCAILSPAHTFPSGGAATWSNLRNDVLGFTNYFFSDCEIIIKHDRYDDWLNIEQELDTAYVPNWYFIINPKIVCIHHKVLSDNRFELEILDPRWITGYIS